MNILKKIALIFILFTAACDDNPTPLNINELNDKKVYGIDISKHQDHVISSVNISDDITFVICKATDGKDYIDPDFDFNWKNIKHRGLIRGAYHFYRADDNPLMQAEFFVQTIRDLQNQDLPPIIDIEDASITTNKNIRPQDLQTNLIKHLQHIEKRTNRKPMIYTSLHFADKYLNSEIFANYPLWLAEYSGNTTPTLPQAWKKHGYKIWQKSQSYNIESKTSDFDIFHGNREDLQRDLSKI